MEDMLKHLEKLRTDAAECAIISGLATDKMKRDLFARLSHHLTVLADEVEKAAGSVLPDGITGEDVSRSLLPKYPGGDQPGDFEHRS